MDIKKLYKKYDTQVLENINIKFANKGATFIIGVNGSGKTTLLNCITNVISYDEGIISIDNYNNSQDNFKKQVFYIPSEFYLPEYLTGLEYAKFIGKVYGNIDLENFMNISNLFNINNDLDNLLSTYSYGMKKKIQLAVALSLKVNYIIGDEILNGLDFESANITYKLINKFKNYRKFILVSHTMDFVNMCADDILFMNAKNITKLNKDDISNGKLEKIISKSYNNEVIINDIKTNI